MLLNEINQLKTQLAALQPKALTESVVGTWDVVSLDPFAFELIENDVILRTAGNKSVVTIKADGTFTNVATGIANQMRFYNTRTPVANPANAAGTPTGASVKSDVYTGKQSIPDNFTTTGTWKITGNRMTLTTADEVVPATLSADGRMLTIFTGTNTEVSVSVGMKR